MATRDTLLALFQATREDATAPYEETNFFEYLIAPNKKKLDDTFKGKRYKMRFINALESKFTVCFPLSFYDIPWDLDALAVYIDDRVTKSAANLKNARALLKVNRAINVPLIFLVHAALWGPLFVLQGPFFWGYLTFPLYMTFIMIRFKLREISFYKALVAAIQQRIALDL